MDNDSDGDGITSSDSIGKVSVALINPPYRQLHLRRRQRFNDQLPCEGLSNKKAQILVRVTACVNLPIYLDVEVEPDSDALVPVLPFQLKRKSSPFDHSQAIAKRFKSISSMYIFLPSFRTKTWNILFTGDESTTDPESI
jgi:hypothetical protein